MRIYSTNFSIKKIFIASNENLTRTQFVAELEFLYKSLSPLIFVSDESLIYHIFMLQYVSRRNEDIFIGILGSRSSGKNLLQKHRAMFKLCTSSPYQLAWFIPYLKILEHFVYILIKPSGGFFPIKCTFVRIIKITSTRTRNQAAY